MDGVRITQQVRIPRAWLARFRLEGEGLTEKSLYLLKPRIRRHLEAPFPFHVKALVGLRIEKIESGELVQDVFVQNVTPWRSQPAAEAEYRMHKIVTTLRWRLESAAERITLPGSGWIVTDLEWIDVLVAPGLEIAPPRRAAGGCNVRLPESLNQKKGIWCPQVTGRCFEFCQFCIRAAFLGIGDMSAAQRLHTVRCTGQPFYAENRGRGRPAASSELRELVSVGLDFGAVDSDEVTFDQIGDFEMANVGKVEVVVYGWVEQMWRGTRRVGETQLRTPLQEVVEARTPTTRVVVLLFVEGHYVLVYNFNAFVSQRSSQIDVRWRSGNNVHCCPICRANFRTELALRTHFRTGACRHDFEGRRSQIQMPSAARAELKYFAKSSCELAPVIVYADLEVFSKTAPANAAVEGVQNKVAAAAYVTVGACGYEPPEEHKLWMDHAVEGESDYAVVLRFLNSLQHLLRDYTDWRVNMQKRLVWTTEHREMHRRAEVCRECGRHFGRDVVKVAHHEHGTGSWLAALCEGCNHAAQIPTEITVCFHNGGRYDYHFLIRTYAKLKHMARAVATPTARRRYK
ncbi:unnamed protein product [Symbiodinium sp. CCMP2592]|nr:unnamed protein product [Symbiodinium sp. CCMP2592]